MATTVNFDSFLPEGQTLFDYQHAGVAYSLVQTADGKGAFIADEQGLGKTRQAIVTAKVRGARKTLVLVKSSLRANWAREYNLCAPELSVQILAGRRPYETISDVCIISFDLLTHWADSLMAEGFDALIVDESHYVKSKVAKRTQAALRISEDIRARQGLVLLLSGTPLLNRPVELVTQLDMIGRLREVSPAPTRGDTDRDWEFAFKNTFCDPTYNGYATEYKGASNQDLLNTRMRGTCYVRRLRNDVLDMDDTHRVQTPLSLNGGLDAYWATEKNFVAKDPRSEALELLTALREQAGLAKIPAAVDWVTDFTEENPGKKVVVWAWHIPVQEGLGKALNAAGIETVVLRSAKDIEAAKARFNTGTAQVIVCSLQAHREGHTLVGDGTNVTDSLFVEQPWHPGAVSQAEDRINRIGRQAAAVFATTLVIPDTVDQWLADLIAAKWETFRAVADGRVTQAEESNIMGLLTAQLKARMAEKYGRVIK